MQGRLPSPGDVVAGRFRLEAEIGRGGMGAVMRARDPANRAVAIKVLLPEAVASPDAVPRFLNEARASRELTSEHAARVFEVGTLDGGLPFMVMELLEGVDLHGLMEQRGPLPVAEVCDAVIEACDALAEAHAHGMVHRDLKPANLFVARRPDGGACVKVLDFGLSKLAAQMRHAALTSTGALLGSPHYMAPEQLKSAKGVDARADIWSLGVVLYELLTGKLPFDGGSFGQLFMEIVSQEAPPITSLRPDVPSGLVEIIARCMAKDREQRWSSALALASSLARFASPRGAGAARRLAERGAPRSPTPSSPELGAGVRGSSPEVGPASPARLAGTMLMVSPPPGPAPRGERTWAEPSSVAAPPARPAQAPAPAPSPAQAPAPAPSPAQAPAPARPAPPMAPARTGPPSEQAAPVVRPPSIVAPSRRGAPLTQTLAIGAAIALLVALAIGAIVLAMGRARVR